MPATIESVTLLRKLAWFAALWTAGVVTIACVAGLLHLLLGQL